MTYEILWSDEALAVAAAHLVDDRDGLLAVFDAVDRLAIDPRPTEAFTRGGDIYRIRVGRYRVLYEVSDATVTIVVVPLGRRG